MSQEMDATEQRILDQVQSQLTSTPDHLCQSQAAHPAAQKKCCCCCGDEPKSKPADQGLEMAEHSLQI